MRRLTAADRRVAASSFARVRSHATLAASWPRLIRRRQNSAADRRVAIALKQTYRYAEEQL